MIIGSVSKFGCFGAQIAQILFASPLLNLRRLRANIATLRRYCEAKIWRCGSVFINNRQGA
jgi:hypothetical protein